MKTLSEEIRKKLKSTVIEAREIAEEAADEVVESLGVREKDKPAHLNEEESELRRSLRAKARQLGDNLHEDRYQETERLEREIAYEHWHRMLFAQFLAENDLLIHPDMEVAVTIEECNQLAEEREENDGFELAAQFASEMLPEIFKKYDPVLDIKLAPEYRKELKDLIDNLPKEVFKADDSLGWVYQFWQEKKKDEINESEIDIGANELPAVTQLFTEHYMVKFLLDNTLGAWWQSRHPNEELPIDFEYLRMTDEGKPAAGEFEGWPDKAADIEILDPAMGSGHFLITALPMLVHMRMKEEDLTAEKAVNAVIKDNLYGLEIDERCTQIAAFSLAFSAWKFPDTSGYRELPELNLACSGIAPEGNKDEWLELAEEDDRLKRGLEQLYDQFQNAPILGSLIDPSQGEVDLLSESFKKIQPLFDKVLRKESEPYKDTATQVKARGIAKAGNLLSKKYDLVATNVPYRKQGDLEKALSDYIKKHHEIGKQDLSTTFIDRSFGLCKKDGAISLVSSQHWLFLSSYKKIRKFLLRNKKFNIVARLGSGAFETIGGEVVNVSLNIIQNSQTKLTMKFPGLNVSDINEIPEKAQALKSKQLYFSSQKDQLENPDSRIIFKNIKKSNLLKNYAYSYAGLQTGDKKRFVRYFWEFSMINDGWEFQQSTVKESKHYGGREEVVLWENGEGELYDFVAEKLGPEGTKAWLRGKKAWRSKGVAVSQMNNLPVSLYTGEKFDNNTAVIVPDNPKNLEALWSFCKSKEFVDSVRTLDEKVNVTNSTLAKVPFELNKWKKKAKEEYPNGLPEPHSKDPTQWLFEGNIKNSERPLQVALARLLGYSWPEQSGNDSMKKYEDEDGIVCLPAVKGERKAVDRLRDILAEAYGEEWSSDKETELLEEVDYGKYDLERWLWFKFAKQHYRLFNNRPFIWHITDGKKGGFSALVNYHKLDKKNLENLTYSYLGGWITKQERRAQKGKEGAEGLLQAAENLKEKLEAIIEGEPPYNIFVRWKTIAEQPIHWNPDLNDGVRMNIRPFYRAGILRHSSSLSINWNKDRGKDPESSYWYKQFKKSNLSEDKYDGERYNRYEDFPFTEGRLTNEKIRRARSDQGDIDYKEYLA